MSTSAAAIAAALAVAVVVLVAVRVLAARRDRPAHVHLAGAVPPLADWVPASLNTVADRFHGSADFADVESDGVLTGHRGWLQAPTAFLPGPPMPAPHRKNRRWSSGSSPSAVTPIPEPVTATSLHPRPEPHGAVALIEVSSQPHTDAASLPAGARLTVQVAAVQGPLRTGWRRIAYGPGPAEPVLALRRRVQLELRDAARSAGSRAGTTWPPPLEGLLTAGIVLVLSLALLAAAGPISTWLRTSASSTPSAGRPQPPPDVTFCPPEQIARGGTPAPIRHPTRSAASRTGACPLAEATRAQWFATKAAKRSTLKVVSPVTGRTTTLRCSGKTLIVCTRGGLTIWLYSP